MVLHQRVVPEKRGTLVGEGVAGLLPGGRLGPTQLQGVLRGGSK